MYSEIFMLPNGSSFTLENVIFISGSSIDDKTCIVRIREESNARIPPYRDEQLVFESKRDRLVWTKNFIKIWNYAQNEKNGELIL